MTYWGDYDGNGTRGGYDGDGFGGDPTPMLVALLILALLLAIVARYYAVAW